MKSSTIILIITTLLCAHISVHAENVFLAQLTSEGARSNIGPDPLKNDWDFGPGEVTSMGLRQHYLVGYDLRTNYGKKLDLNEIYSPWQVNIRSTNHNYTLMSAQAGLEAIFEPDKRDDLSEEQATIAVPPGDNTIIDKDIKELGYKIMPRNFQTLPIHAMDFDKDTVLMGDWCPSIYATNKDEVENKAFEDEMNAKYGTALEAFKDYVKDNNMTIHEIYDNLDALYAAEFNNDDIGSLSKSFDDLMKFRIDYLNKYWSNEKSRKIFANGFIVDLDRYIKDAVTQHDDKNLENYFKLKMSLYYGTLESSYVISRHFGHNHTEGPYFSSQFLVELNKNDDAYTVSLLYNKKPIVLGGNCGDVEDCPLDSFYSFLQSLKASESQLGDCKTSSHGGMLFESNAEESHNTRVIVSLSLLVLFTVLASVFFVLKMARNSRKESRKIRLTMTNDQEALLVD